MKILMSFARATKNTYRYEELGDPARHKIGVLYIKKFALPDPPSPEIEVTVEARGA